MTPGEHYQRAVELLDQAESQMKSELDYPTPTQRERVANLLAAAHVHAKLSGI